MLTAVNAVTDNKQTMLSYYNGLIRDCLSKCQTRQ